MIDRYSLIYKIWGENAVLVEWPSGINESILYDILRLQKLIEENLHNYDLEVIPAYNSLTLLVYSEKLNLKGLISDVSALYLQKNTNQKIEQKLWHLPVCYDSSYGIDLDHISRVSKLSVEEIIKLHSQTLYTVYFIGFLPGFMYLGGLPEQLHTPRLPSPRPKVMKGAVAIGGGQTGIYPQENPGGWNVIGNCPLNFLDVRKDPPVFSSAGDKVKFYRIDKWEHEVLCEKANEDGFRPEMEMYTI